MKLKLIFTSLCFLFTLAVSQAQAEKLESNSFVVTFGNFNVTSGEKTSANFSVTDTVGQVGAGPYGQYGSSSHFLGAGFQYIYQIDSFRFHISKTEIDFGEIPINSHVTDSHTITITTQGAGGYSVYAFEEHSLRQVQGSEEIPDTTCDASTCSHLVAGVWNNPITAGFGYSMTGHDIAPHFINSTYFKSFANREIGQDMQVVMSSGSIANQRQATVTYQAGIGGSQASGLYETSVVYVAVPGF